MAAQGALIGGVPGALIGGGIGFLSSYFSKDPEQERQERMRRYLESIRRLRGEAITRFTSELGGQEQRLLAEGQQGAGRRATALGRSADAESFLLPVRGQILRETSAARERGLRQIEDDYGRAELSAEEGFADRPIQPSVSDYLMEIGGQALNFSLGQQAISAQKSFDDRFMSEIEVMRKALTRRDQNAAMDFSGGSFNLPSYGRNEIYTVPQALYRFSASDMFRR